jgi:polysaccharide biosynthesis protein PslH
MNIGFISEALPYLPCRGGFRLYGGNLVRHLSRRHSVDLVSLLQDGDEEHVDWPAQYCASVKTISTKNKRLSVRVGNYVSRWAAGRPLNHRREVRDIISWGLRERHWDVLHIEGGFLGGLVDETQPVPMVLSLHDAEVLRAREMLNCEMPASRRLGYRMRLLTEPRYDRLVFPRFDRCIFVADRDLKFVKELVPGAKLELIPYGTDTEYFRPLPVQKQESTLVFHSHLGYPPNIEAALEFANCIFPLVQREVPDAAFHLVGADPGPKIQALASRPGIRISANLPDLREAVCSAQIYVCAIRYGTGLKSKVLEAMAMQMPIVGYHPGSTVGIDCVYGRDLLAATSPEEFAAHVVFLLKHPAKAEEIASAGRRLVCEKYSWESRARDFEELYRRVIEERSGSKSAVGSAQEVARAMPA